MPYFDYCMSLINLMKLMNQILNVKWPIKTAIDFFLFKIMGWLNRFVFYCKFCMNNHSKNKII